MSLFLSMTVNKVDSKGRVSVPAAFRAALAAEPDAGVVLFGAHAHPCLEGFSFSQMEELGRRLEHYDLFSSAQDDLATVIFGAAVQAAFDSEGRIVLPAALMKHAGVTTQAAFVGMGRKFQIWEPSAFAARRQTARLHVQAQGLTLPALKTTGEAA